MFELARVLLIDDDPVQLRVRETILRNAGVEVHVATTAESALALLRTSFGNSVGVIITDHIMPKVSGAEFVRRLRQVKPEVPVIVVSGLAEAEEEYDGLHVQFRQKPLPPPQLIELVQSILSGSA